MIRTFAFVVFMTKAYVEAACPNLALRSSCKSCPLVGQFGWTIPVLPAKPATAEVNYVGNTQWQGQVVKSYYNQTTPAACCDNCKKLSECKYWQFVKRHENGDNNICFIYPKNPPTCNDNTKKTRAGGQCLKMTCPRMISSVCQRDTCVGQVFQWTIPEIPAKPNNAPGTYVGNVEWEEQVVTSLYLSSDNVFSCCAKCRNATTCKYWQFVKNHPNGDNNICFLYPIKPPTCSSGQNSVTGERCHSKFHGDPHFVGAQGTHFEFSGMPGKSFCLLTDSNLHINMKMTGYLDKRRESATIFKDGMAIRSWIRELGILWLQNGKEHSLKLVARNSGMVERGVGFLDYAKFDGQTLPRLMLGNSLVKEGGLTFKLEEYEKEGPYDVDFYSLKINGILDMDIRLRVAHPLLRRPEDAETHFSISIKHVSMSPFVHGVLGQTYREGREERAAEFTKKTAMKHKSVVADAESGRGFLDGVPSDYESSDVMKADCRYTGYKGHVLPTVASE